jgi:predicted nuclease with TOPRIM domain
VFSRTRVEKEDLLLKIKELEAELEEQNAKVKAMEKEMMEMEFAFYMLKKGVRG